MSAAVRDLEGRSLLAVFAHPDDESLAAGGLLACCAARGARRVAAVPVARRGWTWARPVRRWAAGL